MTTRGRRIFRRPQATAPVWVTTQARARWHHGPAHSRLALLVPEMLSRRSRHRSTVAVPGTRWQRVGVAVTATQAWFNSCKQSACAPPGTPIACGVVSDAWRSWSPSYGRSPAVTSSYPTQTTSRPLPPACRRVRQTRRTPAVPLVLAQRQLPCTRQQQLAPTTLVLGPNARVVRRMGKSATRPWSQCPARTVLSCKSRFGDCNRCVPVVLAARFEARVT